MSSPLAAISQSHSDKIPISDVETLFRVVVYSRTEILYHLQSTTHKKISLLFSVRPFSHIKYQNVVSISKSISIMPLATFHTHTYTHTNPTPKQHTHRIMPTYIGPNTDQLPCQLLRWNKNLIIAVVLAKVFLNDQMRAN